MPIGKVLNRWKFDMAPLPHSWKRDTALAYLASLRNLDLGLELVGDRLIIPPGHTQAEAELVRFLKPELMTLLQENAQF